MNTLLLTGTIEPQKDILFLNIVDPKIRYAQYIESIRTYLIKSDCDYLVFCENSEYEIKDMPALNELAKKQGKKLEILQFKGNHTKSVQKWRWFGESEIIEYAINNSELIKSSGSFIKITWRYRCENINKIIHASQEWDVCFSKLMPSSLFSLNTKAVNTALFKTSVSFFNQYLTWAWEEVDDTKIVFLEHIYYNRLKKVRNLIHPLPVYPKMRGITGQGTSLKKWFMTEALMQLLHRLGVTRI